jgi:hypothetical protein
VYHASFSATARAAANPDTHEFEALRIPKLLTTFLQYFYRAWDYGTTIEKVAATNGIREVLSYTPSSIVAEATSNISARCSKLLFVRCEGSMVLPLMHLFQDIMKYPANRIVNSTMAQHMFSAVLNDLAEARVQVLCVTIGLIRSNAMFGDVMLSTVVSKRGNATEGVYRAVMCRFVSVVMRHANMEKAAKATVLLETIMALWEGAESPGLCASSAGAAGALCMSAAIGDETVQSIMNKALGEASRRSMQALGGFACLYNLFVAAPRRVHQLDPSYARRSFEALRGFAGFAASDRLSSLWIMRCVGAILGSGLLSAEEKNSLFRPEVFAPMLKRIGATDAVALSSGQFFVEAAGRELAASPVEALVEHAGLLERSSQWEQVGIFDADLDDESCSDQQL